MDNKNWHKNTVIQETISNLESNNMRGFHIKSLEELHKKIKELVAEGSIVSVGGSMTLFETKVIDLLREENYTFLDRYKEGLNYDDIKKIYRESFSADAYFTSTNAITRKGELYNVDGMGNRVAAMVYGPDQVIVVCGYNKIVDDINAATMRNRNISAPINAKRLNRKTPCAETGYCMDCKSPDRICAEYVVIKRQMIKDRITVLILDDSYGY